MDTDSGMVEQLIKEANLQPYLLNIGDCARCGGDHVGVTFHPLNRPTDEWTHYTNCPTNMEPIMMRFVPETEDAGHGPGN